MDLISNGYENLKVYAVGAFAAVARVTDITPVQLADQVIASTADFDFLPAVANHLYFLDKLNCWEDSPITGQPEIRSYDIAAAAQVLFGANAAVTNVWVGDLSCFVTRLQHFQNGASAGTYWLSFLAYDITYV